MRDPHGGTCRPAGGSSPSVMTPLVKALVSVPERSLLSAELYPSARRMNSMYWLAVTVWLGRKVVAEYPLV